MYFAGFGAVLLYAARRDSALLTPAILSLVIAVSTRILPWHRWHRNRLLLLAGASLGLLVYTAYLGWTFDERDAPVMTTILVILVLAWVGFTQPRQTALSFALAAGAAMVAIKLLQGPQMPWVALMAVPAGALLGEAQSWTMSDLRSAHRRARDLDLISRSLSELTGGDSVEEAAEMVGRLSCLIFDSPWAVVLWRLEDGFGPHIVTGSSPPTDSLELADAAAAALNSTSDDATIQLSVQGHPAVVIPLTGAHERVGAVVIDPVLDAEDLFSVNLTRLFASQAGTAVEQFRMIEALARAAHIDALTGMGNRRHAAALLASLSKGDAVILIDLDAFKQVNDTEGHRAGDDLLQDLSNYLQSFSGDSDNLARYGGDEFIVVARESGAEALNSAERLLRGWRACSPRTSISIGLAYHTGDMPGEMTLQLADMALYEAKKAGRDCIAIADSHESGQIIKA